MDQPQSLSQPVRCAWARGEAMTAYHDDEWGVPQRSDPVLFEFLVLEGAQAGLSWDTILRKRAAYRVAFEGFDPARVAAFDEARLAALLADAGLVRNRAKLAAAIGNARAFLAVQREAGSFAEYAWSFVGGQPRQNAWRRLAEVPAATPESESLSRDLRRRGFKFVGPVICYAFMQATGMVNDHTLDCFRHAELRAARA
jgi:DNA-3-methyladenine glycosylase I